MNDVDVVSGLEFIATLQLRTPYFVLKHHGRVHVDRSRPPPKIIKEAWQGIWIPKVKTWRDLGVDMPEFSPPNAATDIGPIENRGHAYWLFLMAIKSIAANRSLAAGQRRAAIETEAARPEWVRFMTALRHTPQSIANWIL